VWVWFLYVWVHLTYVECLLTIRSQTVNINIIIIKDYKLFKGIDYVFF